MWTQIIIGLCDQKTMYRRSRWVTVFSLRPGTKDVFDKFLDYYRCTGRDTGTDMFCHYSRK